MLADGVPAGWREVRRAPGDIELVSLYLAPALQNRGIGTRLIASLIHEATERRLRLTLSTAKINPARRLYERLGFVPYAESDLKIALRYAGPSGAA